eukprot:TRINITY_DN26608_c0_g2_i2.p1 TRINITY_DN26608_c0_g2~~TRINITY_DN26608_c0_g2_i2.p1  ORF type:complete len:244 (-),score=47.00 TRINITY_DN26608_c0_g2_i2:65-796(-)
MAEALIFDAYGQALRLISEKSGCHFQGLGQALRSPRLKHSSSKLKRHILQLETCYNLLRHVTKPRILSLVEELSDALQTVQPEDHVVQDPRPHADEQPHQPQTDEQAQHPQRVHASPAKLQAARRVLREGTAENDTKGAVVRKDDIWRKAMRATSSWSLFVRFVTSLERRSTTRTGRWYYLASCLCLDTKDCAMEHAKRASDNKKALKIMNSIQQMVQDHAKHQTAMLLEQEKAIRKLRNTPD